MLEKATIQSRGFERTIDAKIKKKRRRCLGIVIVNELLIDI